MARSLAGLHGYCRYATSWWIYRPLIEWIIPWVDPRNVRLLQSCVEWIDPISIRAPSPLAPLAAAVGNLHHSLQISINLFHTDHDWRRNTVELFNYASTGL